MTKGKDSRLEAIHHPPAASPTPGAPDASTQDAKDLKMHVSSDPNLTRLFMLIQHDHEWALVDPDIPVLPKLKPRIVNVLEYLAAEFLTVPGPEDMGHGETYDRQNVAMEDLESLLNELFAGHAALGDTHFEGMYPCPEIVERLQAALKGGIFEDWNAWTKSPQALATSVVLQVVRRAMELKTERRAVVSSFDK